MTLEIGESDGRAQTARLIPDHGKLMHLFLVREPDLKVFAHLHPLKRSWEKFEVALPPLPAGHYQVYADITHETGFAETLTANCGPARAFRADTPVLGWRQRHRPDLRKRRHSRCAA